MTLSAKSSLILGENKAGFCREGYILRTGNTNGEGDRADQQAQQVPGEVVPGGNDPLQDQECEVQEGGSQNGSQDVHSDDEKVFSLADDGEGENSHLIIDGK